MTSPDFQSIRWSSALLSSVIFTSGCTNSPSPLTATDLSSAAGKGLCLVQVWHSSFQIVPLEKPQSRTEIKGAKPSYLKGRVSTDGSFAVITPEFEDRMIAIELNGDPLWEVKIKSPGMPSISRDGKQIAITPNGRLAFYDVQTSRLSVLNIEGNNPAWSPNSDRLAYDRDGFVHVYDLAKGSTAQVGPGTRPWWWAPDGESVAVDAGNRTIELVSVRTGARSPLLSGRMVSVPRWSPDGEWMMYTRPGGARWWSLGDRATEPKQIVIRSMKTLREAVVGKFSKGNDGDFTWVRSPTFCRAAS